jgi:hypothetical protein
MHNSHASEDQSDNITFRRYCGMQVFVQRRKADINFYQVYSSCYKNGN